MIINYISTGNQVKISKPPSRCLQLVFWLKQKDMFGVFLICWGPVIYMFAESKGIDELHGEKIAKLRYT